MADLAVRTDHIYKKFRKGEVYNSLRDLLPALSGRMFVQSELNAKDSREFWALQDLSLEVKRGEAFGIIGPNGAGKSTALKILSRVMKPTKGTMEVNGRLSALIEISAGFHQDLTGRENIFLNGTILGMTKREIQAKLDQIIAFSGIEEFIDTPVKRYSSGMHARLGFSIAAHVDPEVLIVDEVLSVGDYAFQLKCVERMKEVLRNGVAVLFVSHNLKTVAEFCSRCLLLEKGRTVNVGPAQEVISSYLRGHASTGLPQTDKAVRISSVRVRNEHAESDRFRAGEKIWIDIEITAQSPCQKLSVSLYVLDEGYKSVFDISTERLGYPSFSLDPGCTYSCTFELDCNLVAGIYHPAVLIYRYDTQTEYDRWAPAATLYVSDAKDVRGTANCFPRLVSGKIQSPPCREFASKTHLDLDD